MLFLVLFLFTVINIVIPISGSATVIPVLALLMDPHLAIGLASFYFILSNLPRIYLFRKHIDKKELKQLLPVSIVFAAIGALSLFKIPTLFLLIIVFFFSFYFLLKKVNFVKPKKQNKLSFYSVAGLSGFLQGTGLAGSDIRNSYLYGQKLKIEEVHATTAIIGTSNFLIATIIRLLTDQVSIPNLTPILILFPFLVITTLVGRSILYKIDKKTMNIIIVITIVSILVLLGIKIINLI